MTLNDPILSFKVSPFFEAKYLRNGRRYIQGDHSPDNVKFPDDSRFPDISLTVCGTPPPL